MSSDVLEGPEHAVGGGWGLGQMGTHWMEPGLIGGVSNLNGVALGIDVLIRALSGHGQTIGALSTRSADFLVGDSVLGVELVAVGTLGSDVMGLAKDGNRFGLQLSDGLGRRNGGQG